MRQCKKAYLNLKKATHMVQTKRRAAVKSRQVRRAFLVLKKATIFSQRFWRKNQFVKKLHNTIMSLHSWCQGYLVRHLVSALFLSLWLVLCIYLLVTLTA